MARKQVGLKLEEELIARVDAKAASLSQTRTVFVEQALARALGDEAYIRPGPPAPGDIRRDGRARAAAFQQAQVPSPKGGVFGGRAKEK